jgi:hypothetical protein
MPVGQPIQERLTEVEQRIALALIPNAVNEDDSVQQRSALRNARGRWTIDEVPLVSQMSLHPHHEMRYGPSSIVDRRWSGARQFDSNQAASYTLFQSPPPGYRPSVEIFE